MTVVDGFKTLLLRIEPTERDLLVYESHRQSITRRLETVFAANKVELIGSYSRGSCIRSTSDIDLLLGLKREEVRRGEDTKHPRRFSITYATNCSTVIQLLRSCGMCTLSSFALRITSILWT